MGNTERLREILRARFHDGAGGYTSALFEEVNDGVGFRGTGWLDVVTMGLWPSHGLELQGYEIKTSRSDWLREIKQPEKSSKFYARLDRFWLVTWPSVAKLEEIPSGWGWMEAVFDEKGAGSLVVRKAAPINPSPELPDRTFFAALCRSAAKMVEKHGKKAADDARQEQYKVVQERVDAEVERRMKAVKDHPVADAEIMTKVRAKLDEMKVTRPLSGMYFDAIDQEKMATAIAALYRSNVLESWNGIPKLHELTKDLHEKVCGMLTDMGIQQAAPKKRGRR